MLVEYYRRLQNFSVYVSNSSDIDYHLDRCAYHKGRMTASGRAVLPCDGTKVARYLSVVNSFAHFLYDEFYLCEVVVIGALAAGMYPTHHISFF